MRPASIRAVPEARSARAVVVRSTSVRVHPIEATTLRVLLLVARVRLPVAPSTLPALVPFGLLSYRSVQIPPRSARPQPRAATLPKPSLVTGTGIGVLVAV